MHQCPGNTYNEVEVDGVPKYEITWVHYKNADQGGFRGSAERVKLNHR